MKKIIFLSLLAIGMTGCSVESMDSEELLTADLKAKVNDVNAQNEGESFTVATLICAGEETEFIITFPQKYKGNGSLQTTNIQVQIYNEESADFVQEFQGGYNTEAIFPYTFEEAKSYRLRYFIGGGGPTEINVIVEDCNPACAYGKGYWRNHGPDNPGEQGNMYPVESLDIAGTNYSQEELQEALMGTGNIGDVKKMKQHLIAVLLNIANGVDGTAIAPSIVEAENVLAGFINEKDEINAIKNALEAFNKDNGCDDYEDGEVGE